MKTQLDLLPQMRASLKEGRYTSIGTYPKFMITARGDCKCWDCVEADEDEIQKTLSDDYIGRGRPIGFDVNWENPELYCDECGERIESAYAEPETA